MISAETTQNLQRLTHLLSFLSAGNSFRAVSAKGHSASRHKQTELFTEMCSHLPVVSFTLSRALTSCIDLKRMKASPHKRVTSG